jgi:hypothetical protein
MLRLVQEYVDRGEPFYEEMCRQQQLSSLNGKAAQPSFSVIPAAHHPAPA